MDPSEKSDRDGSYSPLRCQNRMVRGLLVLPEDQQFQLLLLIQNLVLKPEVLLGTSVLHKAVFKSVKSMRLR